MDPIRAVILDIVGLGFAAIAAYGLLTGNVSTGAEETALALAGVYLGVKIPTPGP